MDYSSDRKELVLDSTSELEAALFALAALRRRPKLVAPDDLLLAGELEKGLVELEYRGFSVDRRPSIFLDAAQTRLIVEGARIGLQLRSLAGARRYMPPGARSNAAAIAALE